MILTLTPHPAVDRILFIDELKPATTMRSPRMVDHIGGKGLDTSIALTCIGAPTLGLSFAAGYHGQIMAEALNALGVSHELIWLEGDTRIAHVILESRVHRHSHIIAGVTHATDADAERMLDLMRIHLPQAQWVVGGGSLPPDFPTDFYGRALTIAAEAGLPTLFDMTGEPVHRLLAAAGGPPTILKMNGDEFAQTFGTPPEGTIAALAAAASQVRARYLLPALVLTLGAQGILSLTPAGAVHAVGPRLDAVNAAGAGDAASAGLIWRRLQGDSWPDALRWAVAVSGASVLTELTSVLRMDDAERLLAQVVLKAISPQST